MQAVGYLRVSSKSQTIDMQKAAVERAAAARGDTITEWYSEKASAKTMKREALERLRADARGGHIKRLYVFRYDRLSRTGIRDLLNVLAEFKAYGVELIAVADLVDLGGPASEMILAALAFAAQLERQAIGERIAAARLRLEEAGRPWGRPERQFDRAEARRLRSEGMSIRRIAMTLKIAKSTVQDALAS